MKSPTSSGLGAQSRLQLQSQRYQYSARRTVASQAAVQVAPRPWWRGRGPAAGGSSVYSSHPAPFLVLRRPAVEARRLPEQALDIKLDAEHGGDLEIFEATQYLVLM